MKTKTPEIYLDKRHKDFADQYLISGNASDAAHKAGYGFKSRGVQGNKLLKRPDIQEYLRAKAAAITESTEDLQAQVLGELRDLAFADYGNFIRLDSEGVPILDLSGASAQELKAITSVASKRTTRTKDGETQTEVAVRVGLADKYRGLELLGKHLGMFKADEQRIVVDVADRLLAARARLRRLSDGEDTTISEGGGGSTPV